MMEPNGVVEGSVPGLAHIARVSLGECQKALKILSNPDPHSRSEDDEGRRIEKVEGGWYVINHDKYREKAKFKPRAEYYREYRKRKKSEKNRDEAQCCATEMQTSATKAQTTHTHTHTHTSKKENIKRKKFIPPTLKEVQEYIEANPELGNVDAETFFKGFNDSDPPWHDTQGKPVRNWKLKLRTWSSYGNKHRTCPHQGSTGTDEHPEQAEPYIR
ncbi:MAG: hypothetical protein JXM79_00345 [Sedimentisphaerales bacterium]|nr:hypothetical protein [Sedimentisphaerales bacterium]